MQVLSKIILLLNYLVIASLILSGCGGEKSTPSKPKEHHLAKKPLKLIDGEKSRALLLQEGIEQAEQRSLNYKHRLNAGQFLPKPKLSKPKDEQALTLDEATRDIDGQGPLKFSINTTRGAIACKIDLEKKDRLDGAAHFVSLARGKKSWWNGRATDWSREPFYNRTVVYKIIHKKGFYAGFPPEAGDSLLAIPTHVSDKTAKDIPAYTLGMLYIKGTKLLDTNFTITSEHNVVLDKPFFPIAQCGQSADLIDSIASSATTGDGIPIDEITLLDITFSRD